MCFLENLRDIIVNSNTITKNPNNRMNKFNTPIKSEPNKSDFFSILSPITNGLYCNTFLIELDNVSRGIIVLEKNNKIIPVVKVAKVTACLVLNI